MNRVEFKNQSLEDKELKKLTWIFVYFRDAQHYEEDVL